MMAVQRLFLPDEGVSRSVAIMGGSTIGLRVAQGLENKMKSVKLFERREDRSEALAAILRKAKVVRRDAATRVALEQEHIDKVDVFVAATNDDERNIMAGVLAREVGAKTVVCVVQQPDFAPLVERLGIDLAVTPRACVANGILKLAHQGAVTSLSVLSEGQAEVMEFPVSDSAPVLDRPLREVSGKIPRGALIATIIRGDKVIVPGGDDAVRAGDSLIVIASQEALEPVRRLLAKRA
jgi:trk system potassium uptake protein TrkA